jgi:hypothetical protein
VATSRPPEHTAGRRIARPRPAAERPDGQLRDGGPSGRNRVLAYDVAVAGWAACWVVLAILVATEVHGLADISRTVTSAGAAVESSGRLLERLGSVPFVGDDVTDTARRVEAAGRDAQRSGRASRGSVRRLATLLGVTIAVLPSAPLLLYLPWRMGLARDRRALRRAIAARGLRDHALLELLARRAAQRMSYRRLLTVTDDPWGDLRAGRHERLARAELARLGLASASRGAGAHP